MREYPCGLWQDWWEPSLKRLKRASAGTLPESSRETGGPERPENEVLAEFRDLLAKRFSPSVAAALRYHVLDAIPLEKAAYRAGIGRRRALRELARLRGMYR